MTPAPAASAPAPPPGAPRAVPGIEVQRDDGPLAPRPARALVPAPEVVVLTFGVVVAVAAPALGAPGPAWAYVLGGWALAVAASAGRVLPRLIWPAPSLLRALEYGAILVLVGDDPWTYALLGALAFHHYDIVYRLRLRGVSPPRWLSLVTGGWSLRLPVLAVAAAVDAAGPTTRVLAVALGVTFLAESIASWTRSPTT